MSSEGLEVHIDPHDSFGKRIGIITAFLAVFLSVATISAHRAHTDTIVLQNTADDTWSRYQAKRIREYQLEMNEDLLRTLAANNPQTEKLMSAYGKKHQEYMKDINEIRSTAELTTHKSEESEKKALYFDFAEGMLEIAVVLSSLYFISRKKLFPVMGFFFGAVGIATIVLGFFV